MLLAPRLQLLAYRTGARDQGKKPHAFLSAQSPRALTVGLTIGHIAAHPVEAQCQTLRNRHQSLCAVTGVAIAPPHPEREALTAHAETQEHLLEISRPIFAMPIGRAWGNRVVCLLAAVSPVSGLLS